MSNSKNVKYQCPLCNAEKRYTREALVQHVTDKHELDLPENFTPLRYVFNYVNRKPIEYHGRCTECKGPTEWDENKGRYNRQCGSKKCHDSWVAKFEDRMIQKTGHKRISETEEGQIKMLANRKISGTYKFKNGVEKTYTGSYELKALEFMDKVMNINPDDLMCPGPILEYYLGNEKHFYITDFYYIPYNLIIEVKDGGNHPNSRNMPEYRAKQIAKEKYIIKNTDFNYLRLTDNDLSQLLGVFMDLKMQLVDESNDRVIHVNESTESDFISELRDIVYGNMTTEEIVIEKFVHKNDLIVASKKDEDITHEDEIKFACNHMLRDLQNRRTVVFDVGGVLVDFQEDEAFKAMKIPEEAKAPIREALHMTWSSPNKSDFLTLEEEKDLVKEVLEEKYHQYLDTVYDTFPKYNKLMPHWERFINIFKKRGFKIYILSNWSKWDWNKKANEQRLFKFLDYVDGAVVSWQVGCKKPDPRIYEALFKKYNIDPYDCIFFDDRDDNLNAAMYLGMSGYIPCPELVDFIDKTLTDKENDKAVLGEFMTAMSYAPMRGLRDSDAYIIMKPNKNLVISNGTLDTMFGLDNDSNLVKLTDDEAKEVKESAEILYCVGPSADASRTLNDYIGKQIKDSDAGLFEILTGNKLLDYDQIPATLESVNIKVPDVDIAKLERYITGNTEVDIIEECVREVINNG